MKITGIHLLIVLTALLVLLNVLVFYHVSFSLVFFLTLFGQLFLIGTVFFVLKENYHTDKTFEDFYEDHPIGKEEL